MKIEIYEEQTKDGTIVYRAYEDGAWINSSYTREESEEYCEKVIQGPKTPHKILLKTYTDGE